jgi:Na+-driven multidrug efflux pump
MAIIINDDYSLMNGLSDVPNFLKNFLECTFFCSTHLMRIDLVGVTRGCGQQKMGAFISIASYYIVGISSAFFFAFLRHLGGKVCSFFYVLENVVAFSRFSLTNWRPIYRERNKSDLDSIQGLWFGQMCGMVVLMVLLLAVTLCTNWDKEVRAYLTITTHLVY